MILIQYIFITSSFAHLKMTNKQETVYIPYLEIFQEENWHKHLQKKYLIRSQTLEIDQKDTEFLIDDCTNPDYSQLKVNQKINQCIQEQLNGQAFVKIYGRTAKDINQAMSKIFNSVDLTMLIKTSQFLTEALDQELQDSKKQLYQDPSKQVKLKLTLRQYKNYLESPTNQFRLYFLNCILVGMCQKVPNHIGIVASQMQIQKGEEIGKVIFEAIKRIIKEKKQPTGPQLNQVSFAVDCFIYESGSKGKVLSIQPLKPLHCLSLFSEQELDQIYKRARLSLKQNKSIQPEIKQVKSPEEFKQVDLSYYKVGWELSEESALQEWKQFINKN